MNHSQRGRGRLGLAAVLMVMLGLSGPGSLASAGRCSPNTFVHGLAGKKVPGFNRVCSWLYAEYDRLARKRQDTQWTELYQVLDARMQTSNPDFLRSLQRQLRSAGFALVKTQSNDTNTTVIYQKNRLFISLDIFGRDSGGEEGGYVGITATVH